MLYEGAVKYDWSERHPFKWWQGHLLNYPKNIVKNDNVSQTQKSDELNLL